MTYWLCITNEENWKVVRERNTWGVPRRHKNTIAKVDPRDKLLIYIKQERIGKEIKEPKIAAVYEAISKSFKDSTKIFKASRGMGNESFSWRVRINPVKIFEKSVEFKPLIPNLRFITNKKKWSGHLMEKAMRDFRKKISTSSWGVSG